MKSLSLEYLAGFFDGEGCVSYRAKTESARVINMRVIVTNTDPTVLKEFERRFGGKITVKMDDPSRTKDCFQWIGWSRHGLKAMKALLPFLVVKKTKAEIFIKLYETIRPRNGIGSRGSRGVTDKELIRRRKLLSSCD